MGILLIVLAVTLFAMTCGTRQQKKIAISILDEIATEIYRERDKWSPLSLEWLSWNRVGRRIDKTIGDYNRGKKVSIGEFSSGTARRDGTRINSLEM